MRWQNATPVVWVERLNPQSMADSCAGLWPTETPSPLPKLQTTTNIFDYLGKLTAEHPHYLSVRETAQAQFRYPGLIDRTLGNWLVKGNIRPAL
ncbi:MAG TPA: hypothetical protein VIN59_06375 [Alphaproteobacteria bacterium]